MEKGGSEAEVALGVGFVGGDGNLFGEDLGGVETESDAELGGEVLVVGIGAECDAAGGGRGGGEGDFEPVAAPGRGGDEVGREVRNEFMETGEFGGVGVGALRKRVEGRGEKLDAGGEDGGEIEVGRAEEDAEAGLGPGGAKLAEGGGEKDEVAERVEFEEERDARCGGDGRGLGRWRRGRGEFFGRAHARYAKEDSGTGQSFVI